MKKLSKRLINNLKKEFKSVKANSNKPKRATVACVWN